MKIVTPKVYLVSRPSMVWLDESAAGGTLAQFLRDEGIDDWGPDTDNPSQLIPEVAGRLCYMSFANPRPGGNKAYLDHILAVGHGSVLEHSNFGFIITGVSRSFTHELVRHRAGFAFSQLSQRYVDESTANFVCPKVLLEAGGKPTQETETKIFVTANIRAWRHFIEVRCSAQAEPEIREVAYMILCVLQKEAPNLFGDYVVSTLDDGSFVASTINKKV